MAKSPTKSLVDLAKSKVPSASINKPKANFLSRLTPEQQAQLQELKNQFCSGELGAAWTPRGLLVEVVEPAGIDVGVSFSTWRRWIYSDSHKKDPK